MNKQRNKKSRANVSVALRPGVMPTSAQFPIVGIPQAGQAQEITPTHDQIARRAYEIYIEQGCPHDQCEQHWKQAEQEKQIPGRACMSSDC